MSGDSSEEKKHQATDVKLSRERDKGIIAKSADLYASTAALTGFVSAFILFSYTLIHLTNLFNAAAHATTSPWENALSYIFDIIFHEVALIILPFFIAIVLAVILSNLIYNKGVPLSFEPISPKFERLNPIQGFKNIFGKKGMVGAAQSIVRLIVWCTGSIAILWLAMANLLNLPLCGTSCFAAIGSSLATQLIVYSCIVLFLVALFDMPIQKMLFLLDQKMGHSEKKREDKDMYGSPEIKSARRDFQREVNSGPVVPRKIQQATIVIYSDSHAVAVYYNPKGEHGPIVMDIGKGKNAGELLEKAKAQSVPVLKEDSFAEVLCATQVGNPVSPKLYKALAIAMVRSGISL